MNKEIDMVDCFIQFAYDEKIDIESHSIEILLFNFYNFLFIIIYIDIKFGKFIIYMFIYIFFNKISIISIVKSLRMY